MNKFYLIFIACLLLYACEKPALNSPTDSINKPVVEAFLQPGAVPSVRLTEQIPLSSTDTLVHYIDQQSLQITSNGFTYPLTYTDTGTYVGNFIPIENQSYQLGFTYRNQSITAVTTIPSKPAGLTSSVGTITIAPFTSGGGFNNLPDPIVLNWENPDNAYCLVVIANTEANPAAIFPENGNSNRPRVFRSQPSQIATYEINARSFRYYGHHDVIVYRLNPEYASLYDNSGNTSQNLTTPFTNINGGLGIFTGVNADTVRVNVVK
jgi:hypothetical protein